MDDDDERDLRGVGQRSIPLQDVDVLEAAAGAEAPGDLRERLGGDVSPRVMPVSLMTSASGVVVIAVDAHFGDVFSDMLSDLFRGLRVRWKHECRRNAMQQEHGHEHERTRPRAGAAADGRYA